ncbi:hypothetical protein [Ponticaulis sp.]|uniref:hypothetical protein n=1 Tax=Ponticaulis sp. TaxID=2020902 RepID=UPI0026101505|nr:hypothetical protein [Ponticaulis sp.]MDF1679191.1 hypothetical protein [Ponticaulis sp.]
MMRIIVQLVLIFLPLALFAVYRLSTANRREPGEPWPIIALVITGFAMSMALYLFLFFKEPRDERTCTTAPRFENGELVPSRTIPCDNASIDSRRHNVERQAGEVDENVTYEPRDTGVGE